MRELAIGAMIVIDASEAPLGILTLRDVLDRIVLEPLALDAPIERYMSPDPITLSNAHSAYDAALLMIRHGVRHVILVEAKRLVGIVSERDLFGLQSTGVRYLSTAIKGARNLPEVEAFGRDINELARQMAARGAANGPLTAFISSLIDLLTERIVELELSAAGVDPATICWIVMGSEGRSEQTLATDQDNGLIFIPETGIDFEASRTRLASICARINLALDRAGYKLCLGEIMAGNKKWCLSLDEWRSRFALWIDSGSPEALLHGSIFFDLRPLAGNTQLGHELRTWLLEESAKNRRFLHQLAVNALTNRPPLGFFGQLRTGSDALIDLKLNGAMPFADAGRIFSLAGRIDETRTEARLRAAGAQLRIPQNETEAWIAAFYHIQGQRLRRQVACLEAGLAPDNKIDPHRLHDYDRHCLRAACMQARTLQKRLALDFGV
jgi:CBS domain-containing protein